MKNGNWKITLKSKILLITIPLLVLSVVFLSSMSIRSLKVNSEKEIAEFEQNEIERVEKTLKNYVDVAYKSIESIYSDTEDKTYLQNIYGSRLKDIIDVVSGYIDGQMLEVDRGLLRESEAQNNVKNFINRLKYDGGTGYVWINNTTLPYPRMIFHPTVPELNGQVLDNPSYDCALGKKQNLFQAFVEVTNASPAKEGFVDYLWPKPTADGLTEEKPKLSYVRQIPGWDWIIGTGVYVDDAIVDGMIKAKETISRMRYSEGSGYFWINDTASPYPKMVMHPIIPDLDGTVLDDPKYDCAFGKDQNLFQAFVEVTGTSADSGGFVDYYWPKPGEDGLSQDQPKLSYVRLFEPWQWIIGTGVYIDDIDLIIQAKKEKINEQITNTIVRSILITLLVSAVATIIITFFISHSMKPLGSMKNVVADLKKGDLTRRIDKSSSDDIGDVVRTFGDFQDHLSNTITDIKNLTGENNSMGSDLASSIEETSAALTQISQNIISFGQLIEKMDQSVQSTINAVDEIVHNNDDLDNEINSENEVLSESSLDIEQMETNIQNIVQISREKSESVKIIDEKSIKGKGQINQAISAMEEVATITDRIKGIIAMIQSISQQTNLLAMNASIEAAHAGDSGRGFSVVADEIRKLAESTAKNAQSISDDINMTISTVASAQELTIKGGNAFIDLADEIDQFTTAFSLISGAITEISDNCSHVIEGVHQIQDTSVHVKDDSTLVQTHSHLIQNQMKELQNISQVTKNGITEIQIGIREIDSAVKDIADLSQSSTSNLQTLQERVDFFKIGQL
ncbi:MAG: methyl-accepting chemotaxis protein [Spirochaetaceae bacterium]|nr:methyl-accepting chemotaxis protein [Spirochaetaceae bacterium]